MGKAQCSNDTGGTCRVLSCNSSRKARCVKSGFLGSTSKCLCPAGSCAISKCVCGAGKCAIGGKCVSMTGAPQSGEEDEENFLETKSSSEADSKAQCSNDTGGTCRVMSCNSSRKARCVKSGFLGSTSKCLCRAGSCAIGGKCVVTTASPTANPTIQCSADTGGTCRVFSCNSSRKASCVNSKCMCGTGKCAIGGKCVAMTGAPQSG